MGNSDFLKGHSRVHITPAVCSRESEGNNRVSPVAAAHQGWEQLERLFQNHSQMQIHLIRGSGVSLLGSREHKYLIS